MRNAIGCLTLVAVGLVLTLPAAAEETAVARAVYSRAAEAPPAQLVSWPGYYYYGVYYGSYRWRYQPYYTYYASPWFSGYTTAYPGYSVAPGNLYVTPYSYGWPGYAAGPGYFGPYSFTWPHYGAYGYSYFGPVTYGY